ncbi:unnamed protein product, partial [Heterosigma akashiwo]
RAGNYRGWTGPELAFAGRELQRAQSNPEPKHFEAAERVFRYLKGTQLERLWLGGDLILRAYTDWFKYHHQFFSGTCALLLDKYCTNTCFKMQRGLLLLVIKDNHLCLVFFGIYLVFIVLF